MMGIEQNTTFAGIYSYDGNLLWESRYHEEKNTEVPLKTHMNLCLEIKLRNLSTCLITRLQYKIITQNLLMPYLATYKTPDIRQP
jgi:hypothetical protein